MGIVSAVLALAITLIGVIADEFLIDFSAKLPGVTPLITNGLLPVSIILAAIIGFYIQIKRKFSATNNEAIQALLIFLLVSFIILTITGIWFRGQGMALAWPWRIGVME